MGNGALAQLGERLHGMQEVSGSIPLGSTIPYLKGRLRAVFCVCPCCVVIGPSRRD